LEDLDQRPGEVTLVYRVRSEQESIMVDELNELVELRKARFFVLTGHRVSARDSWLPEQSSHLGDVEALRQLVPDVAAHDVFVCGSIGWVEAAERAVLRAGVPRENVHIERFAN
jgi:ferredoxin-NADP reductase